jgi:hypothetical protein
MAESDLIARKILGTDPQVGFGESSVLPYRPRHLDTTGFEAMERAQARGMARKEARRKNNEDYYNLTIQNLPEYEREFDRGLRSWRDEIIGDAYKLNQQGISPSPAFTQKVLSYTQAAKNTNQIKADLNKIDSLPLSKFTNKESIKGAALKKYNELAERVNSGDKAAFNESIIPDVNDPEHFMFDAFLEERHGKRPDIVTAQDKISYTGRGERVLGEKVTSKFVTKDKNGKIIPGIDQKVIDEDLYSETTDPDTIGYRDALFSLADKQIMNKALELKANDPKYKDMGTTQIMQSISSNPKDLHYNEFNKRKIAEGIHRDKLNAFQRVSTDKTIGALNEYNTGGGDGDSDKFKIQPTIISQNSASGFPITSPGVILSKKDKPLVLNIAPKDIHDFGKGLFLPGNNDRVNVTASGVGFALQNKKGQTLVSFKNENDLVNYIKTAPKKELDKLNLKQFVFGNIQEKNTVQGDTGKDKNVNSKGELVDENGEVVTDNEGNPVKPAKEQSENRSVAIEYNPNGETGSLINMYSDGAFENRTLSPAEQSVKNAWEERMKKVEKKVDKPKTVVQDGVTFIYNPTTGDYDPQTGK